LIKELSMMEPQILDGIFSSIQHPNFFNGRILTATDLSSERAAALTRSRYLGQGLGGGVVYGLNVTEKKDVDVPTLDISAGLAIDRRGDVLSLKDDIFIQLKPLVKQTSREEAIFGACGAQSSDSLTGAYLLLISSATQFSTQRVALGNRSGGQAQCTYQYEEVGVQFKLIPLDDIFKPNPDENMLFRNRLATACFGIGAWTAHLAASFKQAGKQTDADNLITLIRQIDQGPLTDSDVPLAVLQLKTNSLAFVDIWAVRRPCMPGMNADVPVDVADSNKQRTGSTWLNNIFASLVNPQKSIEAAAFLLQFQNHLDNIANFHLLYSNKIVGNKKIRALSTLVVTDYFEYIPAAGFIPIQTDDSSDGFRIEYFFPNKSAFSESHFQDLPATSKISCRIISNSLTEEPIKANDSNPIVYGTLINKGISNIVFIRHPSSIEESLRFTFRSQIRNIQERLQEIEEILAGPQGPGNGNYGENSSSEESSSSSSEESSSSSSSEESSSSSSSEESSSSSSSEESSSSSSSEESSSSSSEESSSSSSEKAVAAVVRKAVAVVVRKAVAVVVRKAVAVSRFTSSAFLF
jgi:hypothetical protein